MSSVTFRRFAGVLLISLAVGLGYVAGLFTTAFARPNGSNNALAPALIDEAWQLIDDHFFGTLPPTQTRSYGAIRGVLSTLNDPYSVLIDPPAAQLEGDQLRGRFGGIGADLRRDAEGRTLLAPYPDGPAARAGVVDGDQLTAIDGAPVLTTQRLDEIETRLRGDAGSRVRCTIAHAGKSTELSIERAEITPPSTVWRTVDAAPDIGYISIRVFTDRTVKEVRQAVDDLRKRGAHSLVLDLRDNGGGLLQASVDVAGQFINGLVLIEVHHDRSEQLFVAPADGTARDLPMVILVNHSTASASEIVAGALHDRGRAQLIGEQTYGKGSVQNIYLLSDGASLHVTTAEWLTPLRHSFAGNGLAPDIEIARTAADRAAGRDPVLARAVVYLHSQR